MNAPMSNQPQLPPAGPPQPGAGYPSGTEVMQGEQGANGQIENPVMAGIRSILMFVKELKDRGDPRAEPAAQQLMGLMTAIQGAAQESPVGSGPQAPGAGAPPPAGPGAPPMPGAPAGAPPAAPGGQGMGGMPMGPGPDGMAFNPFEPPPDEAAPQSAPAKPGMRPMNPQPSQPGKRPVVLM